jgi:Heterokaryon incompatibility protein Het-C
LNDPAGRLAKVIVHFAVTQVVHAWSDPTINPHDAIAPILTCFVHPAFLDRQNPLHMDMFAAVESWVNDLPPDRKEVIFDGLTREGVREGRHHDDDVRSAVDEKHSGCCPLPPRRPAAVNLEDGGAQEGFKRQDVPQQQSYQRYSEREEFEMRREDGFRQSEDVSIRREERFGRDGNVSYYEKEGNSLYQRG